MIRFSQVLILLLASFDFLSAGEDDAQRKAYLKRRAKEKAVAEEAVKELTAHNVVDMKGDDWIRLSLAYNELGDHPAALEAVCRVSDEELAKKKQLGLKATCFQNANFGGDHSGRVRELAFIDRCLDKKYDNQGVWLWRKATVVCKSSVAPAPIITVGDGSEAKYQIIDREQYSYAFELLERAFQVDPQLFKIEDVAHELMWSQDFPALSDEPKFKALMLKQLGK